MTPAELDVVRDVVAILRCAAAEDWEGIEVIAANTPSRVTVMALLAECAIGRATGTPVREIIEGWAAP